MNHGKNGMIFPRLLMLLFILNLPLLSWAEPIQFPEEELATESVLPIFDNSASVKNRNVITEKRMEIGPLLGINLTEAFFKQTNYGATLSYHFDEEHGVNLFATYFAQGISDYSEQLNHIKDTSPVNLQYAPQNKWMALVDYQYTAVYGKISITKDFVMNLSTSGLLGAGVLGVGDETKPAVNFGIGEKFYFSKNFALRFDLRMLVYQGPNVISGERLTNVSSVQPNSRFESKTFFHTLVSFSGVFLIPGL